MIETALLAARFEFHLRADAGLPKLFDYCREQRIDMATAGRHIGGAGVVPIVVCPRDRFDLDGGNSVDGFAFEVFGADDETVIDLVGWTPSQVGRPMTMFGRAGLVGLSAALNPATYFMGAALRVHETPLAWLQSGCRGCAVVIPDIAARQLRDVGGPIAAMSVEHGRRLRIMIDSVSRPTILVPGRSVAA